MFMNYLLEFFTIGLFVALNYLLRWACKTLPKEQWQFFAAVPRRKRSDGFWEARNFTWYGALTSLAFLLAGGLIVIMTSSVGVKVEFVLLATVLLSLISLFAARWVAQIVERIPNTHTVGGAVFVIALAIPVVLWLGSSISVYFGLEKVIGNLRPSDTLAVIAAIAIAYTYGEGVGRIACISFGCCYGKRVDNLTGVWYQIFSRMNFVFHGATKKISYAAALEGIAVVPIQAITAWIHIFTGSVGFWLFMKGQIAASLLFVLVVSQGWRFLSEFMRTDFRGAGRITAYQWMSLATIALALFYVELFRSSLAIPNLPSFVEGMKGIWAPGPLVVLQLLAAYVFVVTGKSSVTRSRMAMYLATE
jgi:Prolipoprotein diacylglyceryl transferase